MVAKTIFLLSDLLLPGHVPWSMWSLAELNFCCSNSKITLSKLFNLRAFAADLKKKYGPNAS